MLPTMLLGGLGFGLAFAPLNISAVSGIAPHEQGLAGGLFNTSFQFGGALGLAVVSAVVNGSDGTLGSPAKLVDALQPATLVALTFALVGVAATMLDLRRDPAVMAETASA